VWSEETGIYASRITPAGAIDGAGIKLSSSGGLPRIVFDGTNFLVSWLTLTSDDRSISTARIDRDGHIISANKVGDICAVGLALTRGATSSLLAWTTCDRRSIDAVRIGNDGNVIDSLPLRLTPANMNTGSLSAAWNGSEYLVAWEERLDVPTVILFPLYRFNVYATRVSGALTLIDSQPIPIAVSSDSEVSNSSPEVASDGDDFLIAWSSPSGVAAKHVSASGIPAESTPLFIGEGSEPDVAWDGNRYLVAWHTPTTIDAAHVDDAGQQLPNDRFTIVIPQLNNAGLDLVATAPGRVTATYTRIATEPQYGNVERAFVRTLPPPLGRIRVTRR
jgi:hypothetical protein